MWFTQWIRLREKKLKPMAFEKETNDALANSFHFTTAGEFENTLLLKRPILQLLTFTLLCEKIKSASETAHAQWSYQKELRRLIYSHEIPYQQIDLFLDQKMLLLDILRSFLQNSTNYNCSYSKIAKIGFKIFALLEEREMAEGFRWLSAEIYLLSDVELLRLYLIMQTAVQQLKPRDIRRGALLQKGTEKIETEAAKRASLSPYKLPRIFSLIQAAFFFLSGHAVCFCIKKHPHSLRCLGVKANGSHKLSMSTYHTPRRQKWYRHRRRA